MKKFSGKIFRDSREAVRRRDASNNKSAVIFRFALLVAVMIGGIQVGTAAIDSIQNSAAQHSTALEPTGL